MTTNVVDMMSKDLREEFPDLFVGSLVYYYVPSDAQVKTRDWIAAVEQNPAVEGMVPNKPRAVDAFKRAIQHVGNTGTMSLPDDEGEDAQYRFMVRNSGQDSDVVYRDLVIERLGSNMLSYGPVVKFRYVRSAKNMDHTVDEEIYEVLPPNVQTEVNVRINNAYQQFKRERFVLPPTKVRELLRTQLEEKMYGLPAKTGGGMYFVLDEHLDEITAMFGVAEALQSHGIEMHAVPIPNVHDQREMLIRAFENETIDECDALMAEMTNLLKGKTPDGKGEAGKITVKVATRYAKRYATLAGRLAEFSDILEQKFEEQGNRLVLMKAQTMKMAQNISTED